MQTQIQFDEIIAILGSLKQERAKGLKKTGVFSEQEIEFLIKLTYDLTDKDFEYFVAILLERDGYKTQVQGGFNDHGIDILATKDGKTFAIQCKQWSKGYITMGNVGEYYGKIYAEKEKNLDKIFAYVTTSYIQPEAENFLINHGIQGPISNLKLVRESKKLGYFSEEGWKGVIIEIRRRRFEEMRKNPQLTFETGYEKLKFELRTARLNEFKHHLPRNIRYKKSIINLIRHKEFLNNFFQYWDLA
ncbi:restriction endonuclease [Candidatus Gracilibacteria bacterium]|nr:restriction endonuclease [Candidatus Gracilibacteria bacterium]